MKDSGATRSMVRPGKWSSTVAILEMNSPGMPAEMQAMMKQRIGQPQTVEACLTAEDVDNPGRMLGQIPASCRYDRYVMGSGKMDGTLRCDLNGMKQEMTGAGTYSDDQYSLIIDNKTSATASAVAGAPAASMSMKMKVDSRRRRSATAPRQTPVAPAPPPVQGTSNDPLPPGFAASFVLLAAAGEPPSRSNRRSRSPPSRPGNGKSRR